MIGDSVGVLGLDAGGTSGLTWWTGKLMSGGIGDTLCAGELGFKEIDCGRGTVAGERAGALAIAQLWLALGEEWEMAGIAVENRYLAVEDFILRTKLGSKQRVGLASPRIVGIVEGILVEDLAERCLTRYPPSRTKSFATNVRLKKWNMWTRGSEHCRDASRLCALQVAVLLG